MPPKMQRPQQAYLLNYTLVCMHEWRTSVFVRHAAAHNIVIFRFFSRIFVLGPREPLACPAYVCVCACVCALACWQLRNYYVNNNMRVPPVPYRRIVMTLGGLRMRAGRHDDWKYAQTRINTNRLHCSLRNLRPAGMRHTVIANSGWPNMIYN